MGSVEVFLPKVQIMFPLFLLLFLSSTFFSLRLLLSLSNFCNVFVFWILRGSRVFYFFSLILIHRIVPKYTFFLLYSLLGTNNFLLKQYQFLTETNFCEYFFSCFGIFPLVLEAVLDWTILSSIEHFSENDFYFYQNIFHAQNFLLAYKIFLFVCDILFYSQKFNFLA